MKSIFRTFTFVLVLLSLVSCSVVSEQVDIHDELVAAYQKAQTDIVNANNTMFTAYTEINSQFQAETMFENASILQTDAYRKYLQAKDDFQSMLDQYAAAAQAGTSSDLAAMEDQGLSPEAIQSGFTLYVNAFTEAPMIAVNEKTRENLQRIISENFNEIDAAARTANASIQAYNTMRAQLKDGRIAGEIATELGITELPISLPPYILGVAPELQPAPTLVSPE